jgi:hypothetical protein
MLSRRQRLRPRERLCNQSRAADSLTAVNGDGSAFLKGADDFTGEFSNRLFGSGYSTVRNGEEAKGNATSSRRPPSHCATSRLRVVAEEYPVDPAKVR